MNKPAFHQRSNKIIFIKLGNNLILTPWDVLRGRFWSIGNTWYVRFYVSLSMNSNWNHMSQIHIHVSIDNNILYIHAFLT